MYSVFLFFLCIYYTHAYLCTYIVTFYGRGTFTADEVLDELESQMNILFNHVINGVEYEDMTNEKKDRIDAARKTFENEKGLPSSSTVYGVFLNSYGASVFAFFIVHPILFGLHVSTKK